MSKKKLVAPVPVEAVNKLGGWAVDMVLPIEEVRERDVTAGLRVVTGLRQGEFRGDPVTWVACSEKIEPDHKPGEMWVKTFEMGIEAGQSLHVTRVYDERRVAGIVAVEYNHRVRFEYERRVGEEGDS